MGAVVEMLKPTVWLLLEGMLAQVLATLVTTGLLACGSWLFKAIRRRRISQSIGTWSQVVGATLALSSNSSSFSAGVLNPSVLRGRLLDEAAELGGRRRYLEPHADGAPIKDEIDQTNRKLLKLQRDLDLLATEKVERAAAAVREYIVTQMYGYDVAGRPP